MEIWFSIQIALKISLKPLQALGGLISMEFYSSSEGQEFYIHPPSMDIKWNRPICVRYAFPRCLNSLNFLNRCHERGLKISFALKTKTRYLIEWSNGEAINQ